MVVNVDEGDPGTFSDRFLLEDDPFCLIEATTIVAYAVDAQRGCIYIRKEYPSAMRVMPHTLEQARATGQLGPMLELELVVGQGAYICGEETSSLNALEGRRLEVQPRPSQTSERGSLGALTLVHNVEILYAIPWVVARGTAMYAALGFSNSQDTKLLSLGSLFCHPGLYEIEFGINLVDVVEQLGQGLRRDKLNGLMAGGPLADIIPPTLLDIRLGYEEMQTTDCAIGYGDVIIFASDTSVPRIVAQVLRLGARESCSKCAPCYLGTPILATMADATANHLPADADRFRQLTDALAVTNPYGHGRGLAEFVQSVRHHYPSEPQA